MANREEILKKAQERGYSVVMFSGDHKWYSLIHEKRPINLEVYIETEQFVLNHMRGIIKITTDKCGSFMNDEHFNRIERDMRQLLFDLL